MTYTTQAAGLIKLARLAVANEYDRLYNGDPWTLYCAALAAQAVPDMRDAYVGAREDLQIWKRRALVAERQLREAQGMAVGWTDADSDAARLALELECLLLDKDIPLPATSRWWASANEALDLHRKRLAASPAPAEAKEEPARYTVERHGNGWAIYTGRNHFHHGMNWGQLSECDQSLARKIEIALNAYQPEAAAAPALTEEQEREAFEAKMRRLFVVVKLKRWGEGYDDTRFAYAWEAWKARAALRSTQGGE